MSHIPIPMPSVDIKKLANEVDPVTLAIVTTNHPIKDDVYEYCCEKLVSFWDPETRNMHLLNPRCHDPLHNLLDRARNDGFNPVILSAFRGMEEQKARFEFITRQLWENPAICDTTHGLPSRPGHTEHHLGTAVDIYSPDLGFGKWLIINSYKFGFIHSQPYNLQHLRFIGETLATRYMREDTIPPDESPIFDAR